MALAKNYASFDTALILVDMQPYFLNKLDSSEVEELIDAQKKLLGVCRKNHLPVAVLEYIDYEIIIKKTIPELKKRVNSLPVYQYIEKMEWSGFSNENLDDFLTSASVNNVIISGINSDYCVKSTAEHAIYYGYQVYSSLDLICGQGLWANRLSYFYDQTNFFNNSKEMLTSLQLL